MKTMPGDETINLRIVLDKLLLRWKLFVASMLVCLMLGFLYLKSTPPLYPVRASLQLKDESLTDKGTAKEKFIVGTELLEGKSELEDEIGILSSQTMIEQALQQLDFEVAYFTYPRSLGILGKKMSREMYKPPFRIELDRSRAQLREVPIYLSFPDSQHYTIEVTESAAERFIPETQTLLTEPVEIEIEQTLPIDQPFEHPALGFRIVLDSTFAFGDDSYWFYLLPMEALAKEYSGKLTISPISEKSNIVTLSTMGTVPQKEIDFLNTLSERYIYNDFQKKNLLGRKTIEFIDRQLNAVHDSLATAEVNLKSFRAENRIIDISTTSENLTRQLQELEEERAQLRVQEEYLRYTLNYIQKTENATDIAAASSVGVMDPFLNNLLMQLSELTREKIDKSYSSKSNSPVLRLIDEKIANTKKTLAENLASQINSVTIALSQNQGRMRGLQATINRLPESERNLVNIERKFTLSDNIYNYLLQKRAEAGIALASNIPDKSIVDRARQTTKKPVSPDVKIILLGAALLGLAMPGAYLVLGEFFNNRVRDKRDLEKLTDLTVVGLITSFPRKAGKIAALNGASRDKEGFKFLITNIRQLYSLESHRVISFSSSQQADGKTFCALNTAAMFARSGKRTVYVDSDMLKAKRNALLDPSVREEPTLADYLTSDISRGQLVKPTPVKNLYTICAGMLDKKSDHLLLSNESKLDALFADLCAKFEVIIVDTPPLTLMSDFFYLTKYFDINLIVVRYNTTDRKLLEESIPMLRARSLSNLGIVFNDVSTSKLKNYGYSY